MHVAAANEATWPAANLFRREDRVFTTCAGGNASTPSSQIDICARARARRVGGCLASAALKVSPSSVRGRNACNQVVSEASASVFVTTYVGPDPCRPVRAVRALTTGTATAVAMPIRVCAKHSQRVRAACLLHSVRVSCSGTDCVAFRTCGVTGRDPSERPFTHDPPVALYERTQASSALSREAAAARTCSRRRTMRWCRSTSASRLQTRAPSTVRLVA